MKLAHLVTGLSFQEVYRPWMSAYLQNPDLYPHQVRKANLKEKVRVRFRVKPTGQLTQLDGVGSHGSMLDKATLKVVAGMPPWYPAHQEEVAVSCPGERLVTFRFNQSEFSVTCENSSVISSYPAVCCGRIPLYPFQFPRFHQPQTRHFLGGHYGGFMAVVKALTRQ